MKFTVSILLTLIQFCLLGQPREWDQGTIKRNKVKEVLVYAKVPKTNPDYFKEPRGLMLISETTFDVEGRVIQSICRDCAIMTDTDGDCCVDEVQKFFYTNDRLSKIEQMDFHKSTRLFDYDTLNQKRLIIDLDRNDKRNGVELEYFDNQMRPIENIEIDFDNIWVKEDSVFYVFVNRTVSTYDKETKTKAEYLRVTAYNIDKSKFKVFKSSTDFNRVEEIYKSLNLSFEKPRNQLTTYYDDKGREIKVIDSIDEKPLTTYTYTRNKGGLIKKEEKRMTEFTFEYEYHYRFWN